MKAKQKTTTKEVKKAKVVKTVKEQIDAINKEPNPVQDGVKIIEEAVNKLMALGFKAGIVMADNGVTMIGGSYGNPMTTIGLVEVQKQRLLKVEA